MKKILSVLLFICLLFPKFSFASKNTFYSLQGYIPFSSSGGSMQVYKYNNIEYYSYYQAQVPSVLTYKTNLKFFVPNFTKRIKFRMSRKGSSGSLRYYLSFRTQPNTTNVISSNTLSNLLAEKTIDSGTGPSVSIDYYPFSDIQSKNLNDWFYLQSVPASDNSPYITSDVILLLDKNMINKYVTTHNLHNTSCINNDKVDSDAINLCYYIRSINTENTNNKNQTTTQTPPTKPSIEVETPSLTKKTSTIVLKKWLNLVWFKWDTKLSDLNWCNIWRYTKWQYNWKKSIFWVRWQNFIITPNNAEISTFTDEMWVFIFVTSDCSLKYDYLSEKQTELTSCVWLWWAWPNGSLWPNDPNKNKKCCSWLKLINNGYNKDGYMLIWAWTICAKVWDWICDNKYENSFNSDDCR